MITSLSQFFFLSEALFINIWYIEAPVFRFQTFMVSVYNIMCSHGLFNGHRHLAIYHTDVGHEWSSTVTLGDKLIMKLSNETMRIMGPVFVVLAALGPYTLLFRTLVFILITLKPSWQVSLSKSQSVLSWTPDSMGNKNP